MTDTTAAIWNDFKNLIPGFMRIPVSPQAGGDPEVYEFVRRVKSRFPDWPKEVFERVFLVHEGDVRTEGIFTGATFYSDLMEKLRAQQALLTVISDSYRDNGQEAEADACLWVREFDFLVIATYCPYGFLDTDLSFDLALELCPLQYSYWDWMQLPENHNAPRGSWQSFNKSLFRFAFETRDRCADFAHNVKGDLYTRVAQTKKYCSLLKGGKWLDVPHLTQRNGRLDLTTVSLEEAFAGVMCFAENKGMKIIRPKPRKRK